MRATGGDPVRAHHLLVLGGFAVSQPLFDLLARNVEVLVAHGVDRVGVVVLAVALGLGVPALGAVVVEAVARLVGGRGVPSEGSGCSR